MSTLTAASFEQFLIFLDSDERTAADKYERLRLKLVKCLVWKGCPDSDADALADVALDRVALKISQGEAVKNINAYACEVLRFVWLEFRRKKREDAAGDDLPEVAVAPDIGILQDPDTRLRCLRKCLAEVITDEKDKLLITGYYDADAGDKNKDHRKNLAEKLGLSMINLKVKACRLRDRLEKCINECVARLDVTETRAGGTNGQGGAL